MSIAIIMQYGGVHQGGGPQHSDRPCREFSATGRCRWGGNCRYSHDMAPGQQDVMRGPPGSHRKNMCTQWVNTGRCNYGANCRFSHGEQPMQQFPAPGPHNIPQPQQQHQQPMPPQPYNDLAQQQVQIQQQRPPPPQLQRASSGAENEQTQQQQRPFSGQPPLTPGLPQQQQQQQQPQPQQEPAVQPQPQQQQQGPPAAFCLPKPGKATYVDGVRAICEALNIGQCGAMVTDETRAAALRSFYTRALFRQSRFADSVEQYLPG